MTFLECVVECSRNAEFVTQWARLRRVNLPRSPLDVMIDEASGHAKVLAQQFITDVWDLVWDRLPKEATK